MVIRKQQKTILERMVNEFDMTMSKKKMLENYQWFSLASGIRNDSLVLELLKEILG